MAAAKSPYNSYETSWADQWDPEPAVYEHKSIKLGGASSSSSKLSGKVGDSYDKTKAAASMGVKKVKQGASAGFHWIKDKYHKTTNKH